MRMKSFYSHLYGLRRPIVLLCFSFILIFRLAENYRNLHNMKDVSNPSLRNNCFKVDPSDEMNVCMPNILVAGYQKCGTSALYYMLQRHPSILAHPVHKENCPSLPDSNKSMIEWLKEPRMISVPDNNLDDRLQVLNGCLTMNQFPNILRHLQTNLPNLKIIISIRDISEFAYSYYNYRCYEGYDKGCSLLQKINIPGPWKEARSPENFDQLIKNIENGEFIYPFRLWKPNMRVYSVLLDLLYEIVRKDQVLIIKQEDLKYNTRNTLKEISTFLGIDYSAFPKTVSDLVSNTRKWPNRVFVRPSYFDNHEKPETASVPKRSRSVLYKWWREECAYLKHNENITYSNVC